MWSLIMGFSQLVTNLREYVSQNPPGVTFFLCLLTLAISFICLSSYSYTHTLPNPDTTKVSTHMLFDQPGLSWCDVLTCKPFTFKRISCNVQRKQCFTECQCIYARVSVCPKLILMYKSCMLYSSLRTGTIFCPPYHSSSCVWTLMQVLLSLSHQPPLLWWIKTIQITLEKPLKPVCVSRFRWLWLPTHKVAHWKALAYKLHWEPIN